MKSADVRPPKPEAIKRGADLTRYVERFLDDHGVEGRESARDRDLPKILRLAGIPAFRWERAFGVEELLEAYEDVSGPLSEIFADALCVWYRMKNEGLEWVNKECGLVCHDYLAIMRGNCLPAEDKREIRQENAWKSFLWALVMAHWRTIKEQEQSKTPGGDEVAGGIFQEMKDLTWSEVTISFVSDDAIRVSARGKAERFHYVDLKLADKRQKDMPKVEWCILRESAEADKGHIIDSHHNLKQACTKLRKAFRNSLGLTEDPLPWNTTERCYKPQFVLKDERFGG